VRISTPHLGFSIAFAVVSTSRSSPPDPIELREVQAMAPPQVPGTINGLPEVVNAGGYLSDLTETQVSVGYGKLGKNGDAGYDNWKVEVKGVVQTQSLSAHAPSRIVYTLGKAFKTLNTGIVLLRPPGDANRVVLTFKVIGDGKVLWNSGELPGLKDVKEVQVDISGVDRLELVVETKNKADSTSVWIEPRISK
jgi:hypothetical protein